MILSAFVSEHYEREANRQKELEDKKLHVVYGYSEGDSLIYLDYFMGAGLTMNESKIMLILLRAGGDGMIAGEIAIKSRIGRTDTYDYLASLEGKGIVYRNDNRPVKYFVHRPDIIIHSLAVILNKTASQIEEQGRILLEKLDKVYEDKEYVEDPSMEKTCLLATFPAIFSVIERIPAKKIKAILREATDRRCDIEGVWTGRECDKIIIEHGKELKTAEFILFDENQVLVFLDKENTKHRRAELTNQPEKVKSYLHIFNSYTLTVTVAST